jgi:adenine-specific DNA-methyltransferase
LTLHTIRANIATLTICDDIMRILSAKGIVKVFSEDYKAFTAGKSNHEGNEERLFLCICTQENKTIQSPLNYTGQ